MNPTFFAKLRDFCRDDASFEQLQNVLISELQPFTSEINQTRFEVEQQKALFGVITRLRSPLALEDIFQATATEVRQLLSADRVGVFRFYPESGWNDGEFVSEDVDAAYDSAIAKKIHDHCFGEQFSARYQEGQMQVVADIYNAGLSDCHIEVLAQFQVQANLAVPLLQGQKLWGLLCVHQCCATRQWTPIEIEFVSQISNHLGVALQQAELMAELRTEVIDRKQAQQSAQQLNQGLQQAILDLQSVNRELESFSYSVSHDLRAPLRSIDGFSQALLEDYMDKLDITGQDYLRRIRNATQRMGTLIDDLLSLSQMTRSEMKLESVDMSRIVSHICMELQRIDPDRSVEFLIQKQLTAQGDARLIGILLINLLNNAWKFTSKKPLAQIEFGEMKTESNDLTQGLPIYFVRDNGAGFDMAFVDKLFGPFQRLHSINEFPGNGIGLATVQRIARRHGGKVWAEGRAGQGAVFYFTLQPESEIRE